MSWEYITLELDVGLVNQKLNPTALSRMNAAGADGWEAVGIVSLGRGNITVLMKRQRGPAGSL